MTKISGFETFEIVKMGQKNSFWRKPVWGQKRLQILLWCDFLISFFMSHGGLNFWIKWSIFRLGDIKNSGGTLGLSGSYWQQICQLSATKPQLKFQKYCFFVYFKEISELFFSN